MKQKVVLVFPVEIANQTLTYDLVKKYDIKINILKASIQPGQQGNLLLELDAPASNLQEGLDFLASHGVNVSSVSNRITYDKEKCINCGGCVLSCSTGALTIGAPDWKLQLDPEKCIGCKLCIKACPFHLFRIGIAEL